MVRSVSSFPHHFSPVVAPLSVIVIIIIVVPVVVHCLTEKKMVVYVTEWSTAMLPLAP